MTAAAIVLLSLLVVFILQNQDQVEVRYFGLVGTLPVGVALLIGVITGAAVAVVIGIVRMTQLRRSARRAPRAPRPPGSRGNGTT